MSADNKSIEPCGFANFSCVSNPDGWGPRGIPEQFKSMPFQPFNKADKIGKVADWTGTIYNERRFGRDNRYAQQYFTGQVGTQYAFDQNTMLEEDYTASSFQLVDTTKQQRSSQQRPNKMRQMQNTKRLMQKERERRREAGYLNPQYPMAGANRSQQTYGRNYRPQYNRQGGQKQYQGGGGQQYRPGGGRYDQRGMAGAGQQAKNREPSVLVRPDWKVLEEIDFTRLQKLSLPNVSEGTTVPGEEYGMLEYYDKAYDRMSAKNSKPLLRNKREFFIITTTDDPVIERLSRSDEFNVFGTDVILSLLMAASRSVYSWDIVVVRLGNKLFFDKRSKSDIDYPTVSETAVEPPQDEGNHMNSPKKLSLEAMYVNRSFGQQVLRHNDTKFAMKNPRIPFIDQKADLSDTKIVSIAYKYRKWDLGDGINLLCRCEHDGVSQGSNNENIFLTIRAFNEWDSKHCGGIEWSSKIDSQRGAVTATEMKNNSCKLARWTLQAYMAGSDYLKFGYVSRVNVKDSANHVIMSTYKYKPIEFASQMNLNMDNAFGVLRAIIDLCMRQPAGKYLLLKDPNKGVVRLYSLPQNSFESDTEEEEQGEEDEDEELNVAA